MGRRTGRRLWSCHICENH